MTGLKIGVLTFHRCINYGSYWQARCLVDDLVKRGHNAQILDHCSRKIDISEWRCAYQPTLPTAVPETDYPLYRKKISRFFCAFKELPLSAKFPIDQPEKMEDYDVIVIGSDEVWNLFHPWYSRYSLFFGDGLRAERIIAYAASFGNYPANLKLDEEWANKFYNFDAIAVRDETAQTILRNSIGLEPEIVLDPCLQFEMNVLQRSYPHLQKPYIAVYGHNFTNNFIQQVKKFAAAKKIKTISIGYRNDWADEQWIIAGPHDFASFIANAQGVATNFFHGCVFSLRNGKSFVCEITPYRSQKIEGLMKLVDGGKHLVNETTSYSTFHKQLNEPPATEIFQNIERLRQTSNEYLNRALGVQQLRVA